MKFCGSSRLLFSIVTVSVFAHLSGCGETNSETTIGDNSTHADSANVDVAGDENRGSSMSGASEHSANELDGGSGGAGSGVTASGSETHSNASDSDSEYAPIFTNGLDQLTISSRMERNFSRYFQKDEKSDLYHFKSAGLRMWKPGNMERAKHYTGFESNRASVSILTNPFSMKETTDNIIAEAMSQANTGILFLKEVVIDGYEGKFYVNKAGGDQGLANFSIAFGDETFSWIANASFLTQSEMLDDIGLNVLKTILSIRVADEPRLPPGQDVPFVIRPNILELTDGFVDKLVFSKDGKFPVKKIDEPIFQATRIPKKFGENERRKFARVAILPTVLFKLERISSELEVEIDGIKGYEHVGLATDTLSKEPLQVLTTTLFDDEAAYVLCGWVSSLNMDNHIKDFRELARSFRRLEKAANDDLR